MAMYEDMEQPHSSLASGTQPTDDRLYEYPQLRQLNQTAKPPVTAPNIYQETTSKNSKWICLMKNRFFLVSTIFAILTITNIVVMVCLMITPFPNSCTPEAANELNEKAKSSELAAASQDNAIYSLLLNITQENKRLLETYEQTLKKISHDNIKQIMAELLKDSMKNLTHDMAKLVQRNSQVIQEQITSHENTSLLKSLGSFFTLEATVNQTMENIDNIQRTIDGTLPAVKTATDQTKEIVINVSNDVDNMLIILLDSCQDIKKAYPASTSGYYTINGEEVYCGMDLCGTNKGWKRLAYLDMNDTTVDCPSGLQYYGNGSVRACGRPTSSGGSCASLKFPSNGTSYSEVCGRVVGYQYGSPDGVHIGTNIDSYYVDGVSITSGNPRTHVWTMIADKTETTMRCPCSSGYSGSLPFFMGNDYFCESGYETSYWPLILSTADPLWDGNQCNNNEANCCLASGPPWFHKTIDIASDYLELRVCGSESTTNENTPLSFYEIYVK